ncbi:hypothetical protein BC939DRAFT_529866, partial [Gamsiella multidivaricata]|uniref:uncharacterized protein n=1 Tax=Gamsiella multidivaricata TaxID=101098 RepID=UPI002220484B
MLSAQRYSCFSVFFILYSSTTQHLHNLFLDNHKRRPKPLFDRLIRWRLSLLSLPFVCLYPNLSLTRTHTLSLSLLT